ncbi:MAG: ABC transporter substrate-binding protein [Oscillospiraceae bacterium]|nr:ABC transporter substrate-binding protein [Oscillospiraceae bacterium]
MKNNNKKLIALLISAALSISLAACGQTETTAETTSETTVAETSTADTSADETTSAETTAAETESAETTVSDSGVKTVPDREGGTVEIKGEFNTIISGGPSVTEILIGLGMGDKIIAADLYSADAEGIDPSVCTLDFYNLSTEQLAEMSPDAIIVNSISTMGESDPYADLKAAGITILYVPSSDSIDAVKEDIRFLAACTNTEEKGEELISDIESCVAEISEKAAAITEKKSVYVEIGAAPYLYSCGNNTYINDILNIIGAENIYAAEEGWLSNSEESVIAADPDVILTTVQYEGYDYNEIKQRAGWDSLSAVKNDQVYQVNANNVSRPSHHVVKGIREIAATVYPEVFGE